MPELPELEVVREVLQRRVVGKTIHSVEVVPPDGLIVVRDLTHAGFGSSLVHCTITAVHRRGKFILLDLQSQSKRWILLINPKLTGLLQLADSLEKRKPKTLVILDFGDGSQLRYRDTKQMGQLYLAEELSSVPEFAAMGPEALDISLEEFRARLKPYRGEIKGVLTRGDFVAGIGNAYADEILWTARLYPFRKRTQLTPVEVETLYLAMRSTLFAAIEKVRQEMGEIIDQKPREFMAVHMKTGEPCPRCGTPISLVGANQRITNFCRTCQPGGLIKGMVSAAKRSS
jgi:formamidopyrimidine-DNA glycosylase